LNRSDEPAQQISSTTDLERDGGLTRLDAFSDGVFAIAITLLVIEIHVPKVEHGLAAALAGQWPVYLAYVASFIIIGIWWANHHELFEHFVKSDHLLMLLNTLHLMSIAFLPFATAVIAEYATKGTQDALVSVLLYSGTLLFAAITYNLVWHYAVRAGLLRPGLAPEYVERRHLMGAASASVYVVAVAASFVNVWVSLAICFAIALYFAHPSRRSVH